MWTIGNRSSPRSKSGASRRVVCAGLAGAVASAFIPSARGSGRVSFGLTPVFLDSDIRLLSDLRMYLEARIREPVDLIKRRTYQEITALLLSEELDAAWICGFPLVQHPDELSLVAVPLYNRQPLYQSYLIAASSDPVSSIYGMKGYTHAFSDPDSNSGFLVTRHLLATMHQRPETFFGRTFFTYGHRNVIRAVASGLAQSGSVDGYVWDVVNQIDPALTSATRVVRRSELLGFPPVACNARKRSHAVVGAIQEALLAMNEDEVGRRILATLRLDGFTAGDLNLCAGIAQKYREVQSQT